MPLDPLEPEKPVFSAADFIEYQRVHKRLPDIIPPDSAILTFQRELLNYASRKYRAKRFQAFGGELCLLKSTSNRVAVIGGFGSGSPATAAVVEQLAAFGTKRFAVLGLAGGMQSELTTGSLVIATGAVRGEGVSNHYLPPHPTVDSSEDMVRGLSEILSQQRQPHTLGTTWTTDAPFRELRKDVLLHQHQGVLAVDMEAAAVLAVAKSINISAVAAFSIADQLSDGHWRMATDLHLAQKGLTLLLDAAVEYFVKT